MAEKVKPFEKIFPYISYRWKYDDGEYSPYAPFTEVQFISKPIESINDRYEKGFNVFMVNDVENIVLNNIPKGREDVIAVDILYTESISSTVYILKTIEIDPADRGNGFLNGIIISKRSFGIALPDSELTRQFDAVPLKAKSQEFTANRLIYGNYVTKFNQGKNDLGGDGLKIKVDTIGVIDPTSGPSVKTNRTYDVGVVYMDKYGRQGGLLSQKVGNNSDNSSLIKTDFTYDSRVKLTAKINSNAPSWASSYKYYIKDVSTDFYNMTAFNSYLDGDPGDTETANVYLQFDSKDRNKITEDSFLIPRRHKMGTSRGNFEDVVITELSRIPILDIENEAPEIVKAQVVEREFSSVGQWSHRRTGASTWSASESAYHVMPSYSNNAISTISAGQTSIFVKDRNITWDEQGAIALLNRYITSQDSSPSQLFNSKDVPLTDPQTVNMQNYSERLALVLKTNTEKSDICLIDSIEFSSTPGAGQRNAFNIVLGARVDSEDRITSNTGFGSVPANFNAAGPHDGDNGYFKFLKFGLSESGQGKLKGSFFVKVPRKTGIDSFDKIPIGQTGLDEEGKVEQLQFIDFETEPGDDSNLNLYWETSSVFPLADHGLTNILDWSNCIATVGGSNNKIYLESVNIQDKFNSTSLVKGIRVNTPEANYSEEHRKYGLIFSGLYNSRTGINELNKFNLADGITKELEPNYGSIQKLHALDTNLLAFCEDKVFKILADKDALFNADEGVNVTATNLVLGQAMSFQGEYGMSTHPESFATFGNNIYFTDAKRGVVMQLTPANGQLFPISSIGMSNFFRDRIGTATKLIGAYDGAKKLYVVSLQGYDFNSASIGSETIPSEDGNLTLGYSLKGQSWTSRYSFIPESGVTVNNKFYTFKNGKIYLHNSDTADRNNFYGVQYNSEVEIIFNDNPTYISDFLSINYEGSQDWEIVNILADQEENVVTNARLMDDLWFFKEGKYHAAIVGTVPVFIVEPGSSPNADGFYPLIQDSNNTQDVAGVKGFFAKVRLKNPDTDKRELFAVTTEYYISQT